MIKLDKVSKIYYNNGVIGTGFTKVSTEFNIGEFVAILGESGSGKSTLLNVISGLDSYEEGEMYINGEETSHYADADFEEYRRKYVANIFQAFNLVNSYSVRQNVELALQINGNTSEYTKNRVNDILKKVGLWDLRNKKVSKLSGGQKQRVAIARALAKETPIIVADEPTGNLDQASAKQIFALLHEISKDKLVIVVTHNFDQVKDYATRILRMHDGKLIEDKKVSKVKTLEARESVYSKMSLFSKIHLSLRNTFNVLPKFLITLAVFIVITITLLGNYASIKNDEYNSFLDTAASSFVDNSPERIVVNKQNHDVISKEEIENIKEMKNVDHILLNDYVKDADATINFADDYFLDGYIDTFANFEGKIVKGRMPENDEEILIVGNKENFDFSKFYVDGWFEKNGEFTVIDATYNKVVKVVGMAYDDRDLYSNHTFYISDKLQDFTELAYVLSRHEVYMNKDSQTIQGSASSVIALSDKVPKGQMYINTSYNFTNLRSDNLPFDIKMKLSSIYGHLEKEFKVTKTYSEETAEGVIGNSSFYDVAINPEDIADLISNNVYQLSVYADNVDNVASVIEELNKQGFKGYAVKDTHYVSSELLSIMHFISYFMIGVTIVILFAVSYFIIYLVLKSRVTYFAIVRMLGGNVKLNRQLVNIELFIDATLGFIITLVLVLLTYLGIIKINALSDALKFLKAMHFIIVYIILILLSQMIAYKYSHKIFKDSMITTYNMEV